MSVRFYGHHECNRDIAPFPPSHGVYYQHDCSLESSRENGAATRQSRVIHIRLAGCRGLWYSTARGYMTWWFWSRGSVAVDGVRSGYLHRNWEHSAVIITRTDSKASQSYLVWLPGKKSLIHCGEWHAPRLPAFP